MLFRLLILLPLLCTALFGAEMNGEEENLFPSTPDQIATLTSDNSSLIVNLISPTGGQPCLHVTDLVAKGAQDVILSRTYIPPPISARGDKKEGEEIHNLYVQLNSTYRGWVFCPHIRLTILGTEHKHHNEYTLRLTDPSGVTLEYQVPGPHDCSATLLSSTVGMSNTYGDIPSGKYDIRNTRVLVRQGGGQIIVRAPDGCSRYYFCTQSAGATRRYLLEKEILPSGKVLRYLYNNRQLTQIQSLDPQERYIYASIDLTGHPLFIKSCTFTTNTGKTARYDYEIREAKCHFTSDGVKHNDTHISRPLLTAVSSPFYRNEHIAYNDRFLLESYQGQEHQFQGIYSPRKIDKHNRPLYLDTLLLPVGFNDALTAAHHFAHDIPIPDKNKEGQTNVYSTDNTRTVYYLTPNFLLAGVHVHDHTGKRTRQKNLHWDGNNRLKDFDYLDAQNRPLYIKRFTYDQFGNPITETVTGDLTGNGIQESTTIHRQFSQDGFNLLLREETEEGKVLTFEYLPQTNLLTAKITHNRDQVLLSERYLYDDAHNLIQRSIEGDGEKQITTYALRQQPPFFHMVEWATETYEARLIDNGRETLRSSKLLGKKHYLYDSHGNISEEEVYDAMGNHAYTLHKEVNERGDLVSETNALGQKALYAYDERGRRTLETNFSQTLHTHTAYNPLSQPKERREQGRQVGGDVTHTTCYGYDTRSLLTDKTDPFGQNTHYTYDPTARKPSQIDSPPIQGLAGITPVITTSAYDTLTREIAHTDPCGHTTTTRYNAYGSPTEINHPDNGKETFRYTKQGKLAQHTDPDGLITSYTYDVLGRIISKTTATAVETYLYNSLHLLAETDKEGNLTTYTYDGAGRKVLEERGAPQCGKRTATTYDPLGHIASTTKTGTAGNDEARLSLITTYSRDLLDRVLEERTTDTSGTLLATIAYSYDPDGNRSAIHRQRGTETFSYDPFGRETSHTDACSHTTTTSYNEQNVLQITTTDPLGTRTIETQDPYQRTAHKSIGTAWSEHKIYDPCGHLLQLTNELDGKTVRFSYTPRGYVATETRGCSSLHGTEPRTTTFTYTPSGHLATKTLPSGIALHYSYNPLGSLEHLTSSDDTINHTFQYNNLGQLLTTTDQKTGFNLQRTLDPFGNILQETLAAASCNGLTLTKTYDLFDRPLTLTLPDQTTIHYTYDPLHLRAITRLGTTHTYDTYDLDGQLLSESLISSLGTITHTYDPCGRPTTLISPYFTQECHYDSVGNLTHTTLGSELHGQVSTYTYDSLYQLTSESGHSYGYDPSRNRTHKDESATQIDPLDQMLSQGQTHCSYDLDGNLVEKTSPSTAWHYSYDPLGHMTHATSAIQDIHFTYDPLGRRLSRNTASCNDLYLYSGTTEIGAFTPDGQPKELRISGRAIPIALELGRERPGKLYAPILDTQHNIRRLIDPETRQIAQSYTWSAFGEGGSAPRGNAPASAPFNPWQYAAKRFDPDLQLIDFGKRFYDPELARWLTLDPAGFIDGMNLYQYVLNNPLKYYDPNGEFFWFLAMPLIIPLVEIALPTLAIALPTMTQIGIAAGLATIGLGCDQIAREVNHANRLAREVAENNAYLKKKQEKQDKKIEDEKKQGIRTNPKNLEEQLALEEAKAGAGKEIAPLKDKIKDPRYPQGEWAKKQHTHTEPDGNTINVHYWESRLTGERHGFKFKND